MLPAPPRAPGGFGGLWVKIASGYQWLLERYHLDIILRLDADALIIGAGLEECAAREFAENPEVGLLGSYRIDPNGRAAGLVVGGPQAQHRDRHPRAAPPPALASAPPVHGAGRASTATSTESTCSAAATSTASTRPTTST